MNEDKHGRIQQLFLAALEMPSAERPAWLKDECGGDEQLLSEVLSLLDHDAPQNDPLEDGVADALADVPSKFIAANGGAVADRHLLFGILGLQIDILTQEQLLEGLKAWAVDKSQTLGDVLVRLGHLSESARDLLQPLVKEHVRQHEGQVALSLATLSLSSGGAAALANLADPDIQQSLTRLKPSSAENDTSQPLPRQGLFPDDTLRFRVLRPYARGGLGQVYVAHDETLGRCVALKEIRQDRAMDTDLRNRFVLEAEINGNLEHPGIVPVYGLGAYADGRPFYAMRFVEGDSLKQAIARFHGLDGKDSNDMSLQTPPPDSGIPEIDSLAFRQLLGRFVDVCEAMEYAHSRGVLHRDLKPSNIMLGKYGETLIVDWGLAKATGTSGTDTAELSDDALVPMSGGSLDPTMAGSVLGTPQFMSPEQAEGRLDELGPTTDVYALGATLYQVLTGQPSMTGSNIGDLLRRVLQGDITPPRKLKRDIPKDLEAVCLKAMARQPEDRYRSAKALADDVERWLADEPVTAMREPTLDRLRRWGRRHKTVVTTASALVLAGLLALAAFATVLRAKNEELEETNLALDAQRTRAEQREQEAIAAVQRFADTVREDDVLKNSPSLAPLRTKLLTEPLDFFERLREQLQADGDTSHESLKRLANAAFQLSSTNK